MKNLIKNISVLAVAIAMAVLVTGCGNERIGCEGEIIVENPIPDTTLFVGGESFRRDLFEPPVVFRHTERTITNITAIEGDQSIAEVSTEESQLTGNLDVIVVRPVSEGGTFVNVSAMDGCEGRQVEISFNINVQDTTQ